MKARLGGLMILALIAVSCGGSEAPLSIDGYFRQVEALTDEAVAEERAAMEEFRETGQGADDAAAVEAATRMHRRNRDAYERQRRAMERLVVPSEVAAAHQEWVEALAGLVAALDTAHPGMSEAPDIAAILDLLADTRAIEAGARMREACASVKGIAEERGIEIRLPC